MRLKGHRRWERKSARKKRFESRPIESLKNKFHSWSHFLRSLKKRHAYGADESTSNVRIQDWL